MSTDDRIRQSIQERMKERGISQVELAKQLDIAPQSLNRFMKGERGTLPQSLIDVLEALGLELTVKEK